MGSDIPCLVFCKSWSKMRSCCSCRLAWISSLVGASWTIFCLLREFASAPRDGLLPIFRIVKKKVLASFAVYGPNVLVVLCDHQSCEILPTI